MSETKTITIKEGYKNYFFFAWNDKQEIQQDISIEGIQNQFIALDVIGQTQQQITEKARDLVSLVSAGVKKAVKEDENNSYEVISVLDRLLNK